MDTWRNVSHVSKLKKKDKKKKEGQKEEETENKESERREREKKKKVPLLSKIYGNQIIGFRRSKRQSRSMHQELCVGTKILEFRRTPQGREFSYLEYV